MVMHWNGQTIADLIRDFLDTNGAVKHAGVRVARDGPLRHGKARFHSSEGDGLQPEVRLPPRP